MQVEFGLIDDNQRITYVEREDRQQIREQFPLA
jgi:hypothetical protein